MRDVAQRAGVWDDLNAARQATRAKYALSDLRDAIRKEPVGAFDKATAAGDASIAHLRELAKAAPDEIPKIGRAYLDSLLEKATGNGGFEHRAAIAGGGRSSERRRKRSCSRIRPTAPISTSFSDS